MQNGLASKVENRMWYFGETERQALEALAKINKEQQQQQQTDLIAQHDLLMQQQMHEDDQINNEVMNGKNPNNKIKRNEENK